MDELQARFRRLDRLDAPDLWNEAVGRATELELAPRRMFNPGMMLIAVMLLLAALAGTIVVGTWLDRTAPSPVQVQFENGWLTAQDGCGGVIGIDPASSESRSLIDGIPGCDWETFIDAPIAWSSDGGSMAYLMGSSEPGEVSTVWLYDAETDEARAVGACPYCYGLDLSPDGSLVATLNHNVLTVMETEGGEFHELDLIGASGTPAFSPDGRQLVVPVSGGQTGVHVVDVAAVMEGTAPERTLVGRITAAWDPTWSPDGQWIAFGREAGLRDHETETAWMGGDGQTTMTIWAIRPDGTGARQLTAADNSQPIQPLTWSPDSSSIAFISSGTDAETIALWSVGIEGGRATKIYESRCCVDDVRRPAWSPDGEWIAFGIHLEGRPDESGTILLRPDGREARVLSPDPLDAVWQPIPREP